MIDNSTNISDFIKEIRKQLDLSQEDLARELGVSFATINRWENGKTAPSRLAKAQLMSLCKEKTAQGLLKLTGKNI